MKIASRSSMDAEHDHFGRSPTYSQPAFAPARLLEIMRATLARTELELTNWLHEEVSADYKEMIYAGTGQAIETKRKAFIRKMAAEMPRGRR